MDKFKASRQVLRQGQSFTYMLHQMLSTLCSTMCCLAMYAKYVLLFIDYSKCLRFHRGLYAKNYYIRNFTKTYTNNLILFCLLCSRFVSFQEQIATE